MVEDDEREMFLRLVTWNDPLADPAPFEGDLTLRFGDLLDRWEDFHFMASLDFSGELGSLLRDGKVGGSSRGVLRGVLPLEDDLRFEYSCLVPRLDDLREELLDRSADCDSSDFLDELPDDLSEEPRLDDLP